jgi:hypothetical protein
MGQHPTTLHLGPVGSEQVESIEVQWVGGARRIIENPLVDRYHLILGRDAAEQAGRSLSEFAEDRG